jgi:Flp pilus assembly protein protease CpaA
MAMGTAFAIMFVPFAVHLYKGGDLKLVVAASAWLSPGEAAWSIAVGIVLGGVIGMTQIGFQRAAWRRIRSMIWLIFVARQTDAGVDVLSDEKRTVPMAVAFSAGILATVHLGYPW